MQPTSTRDLDLADSTATEALGAALARALPRALSAPGMMIWLEGDLGAGKTTLVRGLLHACGHGGHVKSPTYTLIEPYELTTGTIYHLDLYRLTDPLELEYLGMRELGDGAGVVLVEWPERGTGFLSAPDLVVALTVAGAGRHASLAARSARGADLLARLEALV